MTKTELRGLLREELLSTDDLSVLNDSVYNNAIDDAQYETDWTLPVTENFKIYWIKQRAKRHLFFYLMTMNAEKFKADEFSINQKFDHYRTLVLFLDDVYAKAKADNPTYFSSGSSYEYFGTKIDAGFRYDHMGRDITYDDKSNVVIINPIKP